MQIHSLKLTVQDVPSKEGILIATVFGTLVLKTGEIAKNENGSPRLDGEGQEIPVLEDINFVTPLNSSKILKTVIKGLATEALTLQNLKIAKEEGQLSHYVEQITGIAPRTKKKGLPQTPKKSRKK